MDRRTFIASSGAAALAAAPSRRRPRPARAGSGDAALNALFERIFQQIGAALAGAGDLARPRQGRQCRR